ncbi:hypothetical protein [Pontibacter rugosus]|uniref:Uncharacterized protein n=1 Tax=Pontibacter rugosus TaxID=1745966 RepID=A0ABW3SUP0_9BACT
MEGGRGGEGNNGLSAVSKIAGKSSISNQRSENGLNNLWSVKYWGASNESDGGNRMVKVSPLNAASIAPFWPVCN